MYIDRGKFNEHMITTVTISKIRYYKFPWIVQDQTMN